MLLLLSSLDEHVLRARHFLETASTLSLNTTIISSITLLENEFGRAPRLSGENCPVSGRCTVQTVLAAYGLQECTFAGCIVCNVHTIIALCTCDVVFQVSKHVKNAPVRAPLLATKVVIA